MNKDEGNYKDFMNLYISNMIDCKVASNEDIIGCNDDEINKLEKHLNVQLPQAYKEFMRHCGKSSGSLFQGIYANYDDIFDNLASFRESLEENNSNFSIPRNAVIIFNLQAYVFFFFISDESDNPPIYLWEEGDDIHNSKIVYNTYTDFLTSWLNSRP